MERAKVVPSTAKCGGTEGRTHLGWGMCGHPSAITKSSRCHWGEGRGECERWGVTSGSVEGPLEVHPESLFGV